MRKLILPVFAVATVAILAWAAMLDGPGAPVSSPPIHGPVALLPAGLRGSQPGTDIAMLSNHASSAQLQVFGPIAASGTGPGDMNGRPARPASSTAAPALPSW